MTRVVVDASVLVKCFLPEDDSQDANRLLSGAYILLAPDLLYAEVGNVLKKHVGRGTMTVDAAWAALDALDSLPLAVHSIEPLTRPAFEIAVTRGLSVYDGIYVALAVREGCQLVTADARLRRALEGADIAGSVSLLSEVR